jgi:atypical dual specificity phosphatase
MVMALARALGAGLWRSHSEPLLSLNGFGLAYGERRIIDAIDFDMPSRRVVVVMGPAGTGKSSLLRALCCEPAQSMRLFGEAKYFGRSVASGNRPVLVAQHLHDDLSSGHDYLASGLANRSELTRDERRRRFTLASAPLPATRR